MTKEEKIKEAYGRFYEGIKKHIRNDGSIDETIWKYHEIDIEYIDFSCGYLQPKSLQGIENNNGWIKIESETDLPNETACYHVINKKGKYFRKKFLCHIKDYKNKWKQITHYQKLQKPQPPLY